MNIRDFRYLIAVADTLHFGKAAEQCFVSQPTLSMQIRKLEETLGLQLFERARKKVRLTDAGQEVVRRAREIISEVDDMVTWADSHQDPLIGQLRVGVIPTLGPYLLPHVMEPLNKAFPDLEFLLREDLTDNVMKELDQGNIDVAVLALPIDYDGYATQEIFKEAFVLSLPPDHELANRKGVSMDDLNDRELLLLDEGHCLRDHALDVCTTTQVRENNFRATSLETLRHMVAVGTGITLLPELAVAPGTRQSNVVNVPFRSPVPYRIIGAIWRHGSARVPAIQGLCEVIGKTVRRLITLKR
ncbi:MAG: LysR substrate-binding domain-containing protein [Pseudomonadota bacterium]